MSERKKLWNSGDFDQLMKESHDELADLRLQLQNLMVKFGMRALKTYQAARSEPLRPAEISSLVKYEVENAITDFSEPKSIESIIKQAKSEWENQHKAQQ